MPDIPASDFVEVMEDGKKYYLAHLGEVYSCTCDQWKSQPQVHEKRRTCRHLRSYRGQVEEQRRVDPLGEAHRDRREFAVQEFVREEYGDEWTSLSGLDEDGIDFDEYGAEISCWSVTVTYEADIKAALDKARQREFATHFSDWPSIEEATMEATGTVLDIKYVQSTSPPGICTASPLPRKILMSVFGTERPTERKLDQQMMQTITRLLLKEWECEEVQDFCLQGYYVILYEKRGADVTPSKIAFGGWADDC